MPISNQQVEKYMATFLEEYGYVIDKDRARVELTALVCLLEAIYKFNNKKNYE
jgi:hypothetical protein